jgi:hypothetical protein
MRVGDEHAGINREALATNQTLGHAAPNQRLEKLAQQVGIAEPAVARL